MVVVGFLVDIQKVKLKEEQYGDNSIHMKYGYNNVDDDNNWWRDQKTNRYSNTSNHPHVGARHPNGTLGMVVDPSPSRLQPFDYTNDESYSGLIDPALLCPNNLNESDSSSLRIEGEGGHKGLLKIRQGILKSRKQIADADDTNGTSGKKKKQKSKILCMIYTVHLKTEDGTFDNANVRAQSATWGRQCDGFIAASNFTDHSIGAIDLPHKGEEVYGNMWQKLRSMWAYLYDNYMDEYDYFYIGGDDIYVVVDNLRAYVGSEEVTRLEEGYIDEFTKRLGKKNSESDMLKPRPLIFGVPMLKNGHPFPSGGPGYTVNRAGLKLLGEVGLPTFLPNATDSREDVFIGSFFSGQNVILTNTQDLSGAFRYWGSAETGFNYIGVSQIRPAKLKATLGIADIPFGLGSISENQIGFHLKDDWDWLKRFNHSLSELIYRYHAVLDNWCEEGDDDGV